MLYCTVQVKCCRSLKKGGTSREKIGERDFNFSLKRMLSFGERENNIGEKTGKRKDNCRKGTES